MQETEKPASSSQGGILSSKCATKMHTEGKATLHTQTTAAGSQKEKKEPAGGKFPNRLGTEAEKVQDKTPKQFKGAKHTLSKKIGGEIVNLWGRKTVNEALDNFQVLER